MASLAFSHTTLLSGDAAFHPKNAFQNQQWHLRSISCSAITKDTTSLQNEHPQQQQQLCIKLSPAPLLATVAACLVLSVSPHSAEAGILSGSKGLESFDLPSLPKPEFLQKMQEESKMKYDALDSKFKSSPLVQELLKRSKENTEKHQRELQDKYCQRGADWGVGDCSTAAMSEGERSAFMESLKQNSPE